jgi:hypothetical protein
MKTQILSVAIALGTWVATTQAVTANNKLVERNKAIEKVYEVVNSEEKETLKIEAELTFENWMTNASFWHLESNVHEENVVPNLEPLKLEPWMSSDEAFKFNQIKTEKTVENWMTNNKLWRFE